MRPATRSGWRAARRSAIAAPIEMPPSDERAGLDRDGGEDVVGEEREAERAGGAERRAAVAAAFEGDAAPAGVVGEARRHLRRVAAEAVLEEDRRAVAAGCHAQRGVVAAKRGHSRSSR